MRVEPQLQAYAVHPLPFQAQARTVRLCEKMQRVKGEQTWREEVSSGETHQLKTDQSTLSTSPVWPTMP